MVKVLIDGQEQVAQITNIGRVTTLDGISGVGLTGRDWSLDFQKLQNVDISLSAHRNGILGVGSKTLTDIEAVLSSLKSALASIASDKLLTTPDNPSNLDVAVSTRASESTLSSVLSQLDITLSALRDALKGANSKDFSTLEYDVESLLIEFQPVCNSDSVDSGSNTSGLIVELDKGGRPYVDVYYNVGGAATIYIEVSADGTTWRLLDTITTSTGSEGVEQFPWVGHRYVRARCPTTGIDITLEITASR